MNLMVLSINMFFIGMMFGVLVYDPTPDVVMTLIAAATNAVSAFIALGNLRKEKSK